jgi:glycosyltransferase involved in cell wall biosynthesis
VKILLVHRWFWPDSPPYASMLRSIGKRLSVEGHDVTVLTSQPSYTAETAKRRMPRRQQLDGFEVRRCRMLPESKKRLVLRALNMLLFMWAIFRHIVVRRRQNRYDCVMVSTMPPVLVAASARWASRLVGADMIYHMMDIYPEIALYSGMTKQGWLSQRLRSIDRKNCRLASRVVVLSSDMQQTLAARGLETHNIRVLNNFSLESFAGQGAIPAGMEKPEGSFRVLFAGNLGRFQGLETVIEAVGLLDDLGDLRFEFMGSGVGKQGLQDQAGPYLNRRIFFHEYQPIEIAVAVIATADLSIISLNPDIYRAAYPSKTMTCLSAGSPLLAIIEAQSELAQLIEREAIGFHAPQNDPAALADAIRLAYRQRNQLEPMRQRAFALAEREFSSASALARWASLFAQLQAERKHKMPDPQTRS